MKAIVNSNIILKDSILIGGTILIDDDLIIETGPSDKIEIPKGTEIIDADGQFVGPGLIDIHTHSGGEFWFYDAPEKAAKAHLEHGTTCVLPALYFSMDKNEYVENIQKIKEVVKQDKRSNIKGLYMEGPYLNPKYGADRENFKWSQGVVSEDYDEIINVAGDFAKVWCIAPELDNIMDFVVALNNKNPSAIISVAHSEASPCQIERCMPYGLRLCTHHTNATGNLQKYPECRGVSVDETVSYYDDIYAELICDSKGIHVDPFMLRLVLKIKGKDKVILISDACVYDGPKPEGYEDVDDINFDFSGEIAGSKLTLDKACRNMMKHTGIGLVDVFRLASYNPAKLLGFRDIGEIKKGNKSDLIIVDSMMNVSEVFLSGERILK